MQNGLNNERERERERECVYLYHLLDLNKETRFITIVGQCPEIKYSRLAAYSF